MAMTKDQALAIHTAIQNDAYSGLGNAEIIAKLNSEYRRTDVTAKSLVSRLGRGFGRRVLVSINAASSADPIIQSVMGLLNSGQSINAGDPETVAALQELEAAGIEGGMQIGDAEKIIALARRYGTVDQSALDAARAVGQAKADYESAVKAAQDQYDADVQTALGS